MGIEASLVWNEESEDDAAPQATFEGKIYFNWMATIGPIIDELELTPLIQPVHGMDGEGDDDAWGDPGELEKAAKKAIRLIRARDPRFEPEAVETFSDFGDLGRDLGIDTRTAEGKAQVRDAYRDELLATLENIEEIATWARKAGKTGIAFYAC